MNHARYNKLWVSDRAYNVAEWLIYIHEVQDGHGLAPYLGVQPYLDNYNAVRLWVQIKLTRRPPELQTLGDVRKAFRRLLPVDTGE